jgi:prepilin-type N-terminal cleavage/methylation domain-containing protein
VSTSTESKKKRHSSQGQAGFTLVELMVACGIFAIGMVGILGSMIAAVNSHRIAVVKNEAYVQIQNQINSLNLNKNTVFQFDINDPLAIELEGLPGSSLTLYLARPDDPDTAGDESEIFELPLTDQEVDDEFPDGLEYSDGTPYPAEVIFEALVPALNSDNSAFYRFRMSAMYY